MPPLGGALLPLAEAAAAGRGSKGSRGSGGGETAAAAAARAWSLGGASSRSPAVDRSPLLVSELASSSKDDGIEASIEGTDWEEVASSCVERLLAARKSGEEGQGQEDVEEEGEGAEEETKGEDDKTSPSSSAPPSPWAGLGAVVRALEERPSLASSLGSSSSTGRVEMGTSKGRVRVSAWAAGASSSSSSPSLPPWSETFELEPDPNSAPEEVDIPLAKGQKEPRRGFRRRLRLAAAAPAAAAEAGAASPPSLLLPPTLLPPSLLPPTLPPSGRLVASTFGSSRSASASSASATYSLPSCELSLEIDSLPRSLWVTLGSLEEDGEGEQKQQEEEENGSGESGSKSKNGFVLQLKLRRQPAGRASRRKQNGLWGAYVPCGGAITTTL